MSSHFRAEIGQPGLVEGIVQAGGFLLTAALPWTVVIAATLPVLLH